MAETPTITIRPVREDKAAVEGLRKMSVIAAGQLHDEYLMARYR